MKLLSRSRRLRKKLPKALAEIPEAVSEHLPCRKESALLKTVGWVTAGMGALAIGVVVGRELRLRYKFNRRTPYDFYSHSGDQHEFDFGVGV